ncbi:MAG: hypothetical protein ACK4GO_16790 [Gemmobacter sp.]
MNPEAVAHFRSLCRLRDFLSFDPPEVMFAALLEVARWAKAEQRRPNPANDALLSAASDLTSIQMGLFMHLATIDRAFFNLAKRMAARTLGRHCPPARMYCHMAAALLAAGDGPKSSKPKLARDVVIILAVAAGTDAGWTPTESFKPDRPPRSGCGRLAAALIWDYSNAERVWKAREKRLHEAGFSPDQVSEFSRLISPMIDGTD